MATGGRRKRDKAHVSEESRNVTPVFDLAQLKVDRPYRTVSLVCQVKRVSDSGDRHRNESLCENWETHSDNEKTGKDDDDKHVPPPRSTRFVSQGAHDRDPNRRDEQAIRDRDDILSMSTKRIRRAICRRRVAQEEEREVERGETNEGEEELDRVVEEDDRDPNLAQERLTRSQESVVVGRSVQSGEEGSVVPPATLRDDCLCQRERDQFADSRSRTPKQRRTLGDRITMQHEMLLSDCVRDRRRNERQLTGHPSKLSS